MRVLLISTEFPPLVGGIGTFTHNLAKGLQEAGLSVRVLTSVGAGSKESVMDVPVIRTAPWLNHKFVKIAPLLWAGLWICVQERPDKVVAMVWTHEGIVAYLLKRMLGINYALVAHGTEILRHKKSRLRRALMVLIFRGAEKVIANSGFTKRLVMELGIDAGRVVVVNPPIDVPDAQADFDTKVVDEKFHLKGKRVILTASRLVKRKGHAQVIKVLGELKDRYTDLVYVMTGDGEYRLELEELALKYGVSDRVRMTGYVSQDELRQLYRRAEVYISPSQDDQGDVEGFGIALIEAGAHGKPVIAGRSGGVTDAVVDGETGFLVDASRLDEIARALTTLLDNESLRKQMGENARQRVLRELSIKHQALRVKELLCSNDVKR